MNRFRHILVLALLGASSFQVWGWVDAVPIQRPLPGAAPVLAKQLFNIIPNNTTTIPALKLNHRSKSEHFSLNDGSLYFGKLAGFDAQRGFFGNIHTSRQISSFP